MANIPNEFNFGDANNLSMEELVIKLQRMYYELAQAVNSKPDLYQRNTNGLATDTFLAQGSININLSTNKVEMLTNHNSSTNVTWTTLS